MFFYLFDFNVKNVQIEIAIKIYGLLLNQLSALSRTNSKSEKYEKLFSFFFNIFDVG